MTKNCLLSIQKKQALNYYIHWKSQRNYVVCHRIRNQCTKAIQRAKIVDNMKVTQRVSGRTINKTGIYDLK